MSGERRLRRTVIKEELVALCDGDAIAALILNQMLYWSSIAKHHDKLLAEEKQRLSMGPEGTEVDIQLTQGWIYKSSEEMAEEIQLGASTSTVRRRFMTLVEKGWLKERDNPRHRYDKTKQYRADLLKISEDLKEIGYHLEGWKLDDNSQIREIGNVHSTPPSRARTITHTDAPIRHSDESIRHGESAIPETTTETTHIEEKTPDGVQKKASFDPVQKKIKKLTTEEAATRWQELLNEDDNSDQLMEIAEMMAEENATGEVAITRVWREVGERYLKQKENNADISAEAWSFGFDRAIAAGAPNMGYVKKAAKGYKPEAIASGRGSHRPRQERRKEFKADYDFS